MELGVLEKELVASKVFTRLACPVKSSLVNKWKDSTLKTMGTFWIGGVFPLPKESLANAFVHR